MNHSKILYIFIYLQKHHKKGTHNNSLNGKTLDEDHSASPVPPSIDSESEEAGENEEIYSVANSDIFGRYLVAKRTIRPGELIICEEPIVIGPSSETDCSCLGCYIPLLPSDDNFK